MEENSFETKNKTSTQFIKCDGCGANMIFEPETHSLTCLHCGNKKVIESEGNAEEIDIGKGFEDDNEKNFEKLNSWENGEVRSVFRCSNCGAEVVLAGTETAKSCPFCGTAHVEKTENLSGIKPNAILPFSFGEEKAIEYGKKWAKKRLFAPRKFKKNLSAENVKGVYAPCFTFDSYTTSVYEGRIGIHHTRTVGSGKDQRTETWTEWKSISGTYYGNFDDILITAGSKFDQKKLDKTAPYDTNSSEKYSEKYMLGFMAYKYDHSLSDCWGDAKKRMDELLRRAILNQYTYDVVDYLNVSTTHDRVTFKYGMVPVYIGNFTYNKKLYNFFINGTTGKTYGKYPVSPIRVGIAVLLGLAVIVGIILLIISGE